MGCATCKEEKKSKPFKAKDEPIIVNIPNVIQKSEDTSTVNDVPYNFDTSKLVWSNGSKSFKREKNGWLSLISNESLPPYFTVTLKIVNLPGHEKSSNGGIGVTSNKMISSNICIGIQKKEYGIMTQIKGRCYSYNGDNEVIEEYGKEYKNGDIVVIEYRKDKNLYFNINGLSQGPAFKKIMGPFYLMGSLFFKGSQIDIIEITNK